jgi:hypothetical protein
MSHGPLTFRQRDLTAAIKAMRAAGCEVARVEIKDGKIIVVTGKAIVDGTSGDTNEWDAVYGQDPA